MREPSQSDHPSFSLAKNRSFARPILRALGLGDPHQDLSSVLAGIDAALDPAARVLALAQLVRWIRGSSFSPVGRGPQAALVRFRLLLRLLERHDTPRQAVSRLISTVLREAEATSLFAQTELNEQGGLFSEIARRIGDQILPPPPRPHELAYAARVAFVSDQDDEWLSGLTDGEWLRFCALLDALDATVLVNDLRDSVLNVALQAAALGLSEEVRARVRGGRFVGLARLASRWRDSLDEGDASLLRGAALECHEGVTVAYAAIETQGVSLSLVYRLETISSLVRRLEMILDALATDLSPDERRLRARALLHAVVRSRLARRSVKALFGMNFDIFARRLVQHAGETGEHYIARDRLEFWEMLRAGCGGGAVTVATTFIKFLFYSFGLPLFFEGTLMWANYSGSFIFLQLMGFSLATKQPSMTSAALAEKLSRRMDRREMEGFVEEIACISRSQFIAAVGNVGFVMPGALLASLAYEKIAGHAVISVEIAQQALAGHHPRKSGCLAYAALTGVILWLSSFGAGLLQNWVIYRGLPEAIGQNAIMRAVFGPERAPAIGRWVGHNASGVGGNLAIGFLLAFVPVAGHFFGLPLDIRHVTLSSGTIVVALRSIGFATLTWKTVGIYSLSIVLIGALNFGVSTACALAVAARAQRVRRAWFRAVIGFAWLSFLRKPWRFFWPPAHPVTGGPSAAD